MTIKFTKMHGLGNDFIIIDGVRQKFHPDANLIRQWADRHTGIGFDQLLLIEPAPNKTADFSYRIFNADGGEVAQCGNGARCVALYLQQEKLTSKKQITLATKMGQLEATLEANGLVTVNMGIPDFTPANIPFIADQQQTSYPISLNINPTNDQTVEIHAVSVGNPHCVLVVPDVTQAPVQQLGALLTQHPRFPEQVNVGFMQIIDPQHLRIRVYERGAGETLACGSGACAAVVIGKLLGKLTDKVNITLPGGGLTVSWQGDNMPVYLTGPAVRVFDGTI